MKPLAQKNFINWLIQRKNTLCHRQILVISGAEEWLNQWIEHICNELDYQKPLLVNFSFENKQSIKDAQYTQVLGEEFDGVFYNCDSSLRASALAALSGVIKQGGLMVIASQSGIDKYNATSHFRQWLTKQLLSDVQVNWLDASQFTGRNIEVKDQTRNIGDSIVYSEQSNLITTLISEVKKRTTLKTVLKADRGRGKSSALGILAARLATDEDLEIIYTAPRPQMLVSFKLHCRLNSKESNNFQNVKFWPLDKLLAENPQCDLLIVDEAAAVPNQILTKLLRLFSRVIFSSTTDGYEGSGMSFDHKFIPFMRQSFPTEHIILTLNQPIRWFANDCLEEFWWNTLLIKSSTRAMNPENSLCLGENGDHSLQYRQIRALELINHPNLLQQSIQLLINAHYQTTPDDLMRILDDPSQSIHIMFSTQSDQNLDSHVNLGDDYLDSHVNIDLDSHVIIVAIALVNSEGGHSLSDTAEMIASGTRRLQGHLSAQRLAYVYATPELAILNYQRVVRIAVSPEHQGKGIGARLLQHLDHWANSLRSDFLVSSFGATAELLNFWFRQKFTPINLGLTADASNGLNSVIVCKALNQKAQDIFKFMVLRFGNHIQYQKCRRLKFIQHEVVRMIEHQILEANEYLSLKLVDNMKSGVDAVDLRKIQQFIEKKRPIYSCELELFKLLKQLLETESKVNQETLLYKLLVKNLPIDGLLQYFSLTGKKQMEDLARREAISILAQVKSH